MSLCDAQAAWSWGGGVGGGGAHCERFLCAASHRHKDARTTLCPFEGLAGSLSAHGLWELYSTVLPWGARCAPPAARRAARGVVLCCLCSAWRGASSDSERRCHWLHISAGDLGQCWKRFSDASTRKPAQPVWPWEFVPVAVLATNRGYSSSAYCCEPLSCQSGTHPLAGPKTADSLPPKLRGLSGGTCDSQISPQCLGKDMGKPHPLRVIEKRGGHKRPGLGPISNPKPPDSPQADGASRESGQST